MALSEEELARAHDIAQQIALAEMVRFVIGEVFFDRDPQVFRRRLAAIDQGLITSLNSRRLWDQASDETEAVIKESASGYVSRLLASIKHPAE